MPEDVAEPTAMEGWKPAEAAFDFIKSQQHRVVHAEGVWGGVSPRGRISLTFFNERFPIPTRVVHEIDADGQVGKELKREKRKGIVREAEVTVLMSLEEAEVFSTWLQEKLVTARKLVQPPAADEDGGECA